MPSLPIVVDKKGMLNPCVDIQFFLNTLHLRFWNEGVRVEQFYCKSTAHLLPMHGSHPLEGEANEKHRRFNNLFWGGGRVAKLMKLSAPTIYLIIKLAGSYLPALAAQQQRAGPRGGRRHRGGGQPLGRLQQGPQPPDQPGRPIPHVQDAWKAESRQISKLRQKFVIILAWGRGKGGGKIMREFRIVFFGTNKTRRHSLTLWINEYMYIATTNHNCQPLDSLQHFFLLFCQGNFTQNASYDPFIKVL